MQVSSEVAIKVWNYAFGNVEWATDCFGIYMNKNDYGDTERKRNNRPGNTSGKSYNYGWTIDHIKPTALFGPDDLNNYEPMWHGNNNEKSDNFPGFTIGSKQYNVISYQTPHNNTAFGIQDVASGLRVDWKKNGKYFY